MLAGTLGGDPKKGVIPLPLDRESPRRAISPGPAACWQRKTRVPSSILYINASRLAGWTAITFSYGAEFYFIFNRGF